MSDVSVEAGERDPAVPVEPDKSLSELVRKLTTDFGVLVETHVQLAKAELKDELTRAGKRAGFMAAGGVGALVVSCRIGHPRPAWPSRSSRRASHAPDRVRPGRIVHRQQAAAKQQLGSLREKVMGAKDDATDSVHSASASVSGVCARHGRLGPHLCAVAGRDRSRARPRLVQPSRCMSLGASVAKAAFRVCNGMADAEFDVQATAIADQVRDLKRDGAMAPHEMFAAGCRGSANPAALAWIAENLALEPASKVTDLGSGLGGPSSWIVARYGCVVVALEPASSAAAASRALFPLLVVNASSTDVPFRTDAFDAALLLGVISVVDDGEGVLREAQRVARNLGLLDYCSTLSRDVNAGGSRFRTPTNLARLAAASGWNVQQTSTMPVEAPRSWTDAVAKVVVRPEPTEEEVAAVIKAGSIAPFMLVASR